MLPPSSASLQTAASTQAPGSAASTLAMTSPSISITTHRLPLPLTLPSTTSTSSSITRPATLAPHLASQIPDLVVQITRLSGGGSGGGTAGSGESLMIWVGTTPPRQPQPNHLAAHAQVNEGDDDQPENGSSSTIQGSNSQATTTRSVVEAPGASKPSSSRLGRDWACAMPPPAAYSPSGSNVSRSSPAFLGERKRFFSLYVCGLGLSLLVTGAGRLDRRGELAWANASSCGLCLSPLRTIARDSKIGPRCDPFAQLRPSRGPKKGLHADGRVFFLPLLQSSPPNASFCSTPILSGLTPNASIIITNDAGTLDSTILNTSSQSLPPPFFKLEVVVAFQQPDRTGLIVEVMAVVAVELKGSLRG